MTEVSVRRSKVVIGIVSYRSEQESAVLIDSISSLAGPVEIHTVVVDNSGSWRASYTGKRVDSVLLPERNLGFAGAVNLLIDEAHSLQADWLWLLNPDTTVAPNSLERLLHAVPADADIISSHITQSNEESIWFGGGLFDSTTGRTQHAHYNKPAQEVATGEWIRTGWCSGAHLLARGSSLSRLGHLDEHLFLYLEELEWQLRSCAVAYVLSEPLVSHIGGSSTIRVSSLVGETFMARNRLYLMRRHATSPMLKIKWLTRWLRDFILSPLAHGRGVTPAALGFLALDFSGHETLTLCQRKHPLLDALKHRPRGLAGNA